MSPKTFRRIAAVSLLMCAMAAQAAVLPEDRADLMFHRYEGGGITVQGPSILVRKKLGESVSATANYYVDAITSASIDVVVSGASEYTENRTQIGLSTDYLHGKTTYSANFVDSKENDYKARTWSMSISQDMFGDLTTLSIGYSQGKDRIFDSTDPTFADIADRRNYRLGLTQVLTRDMLLSLNFETITEEGYLQNPYRFMRYENTSGSYTLAPEVFPRTRTGNAGSARVKYYLPWRAAVEGSYRFYADTWGIQAHTAGIEYTHPLWGRWVFDGSYRFYTQNSADFFMDLFPRADYQNFMARDKETSALTNHTLGAGVAYEVPVNKWVSWLKRGTANLRYTYMMIDYKEFRDLREYPPGTATPGTEPLYSLNASVIQAFFSIWF